MSKKLANIISITLMLIGAAFAIYTWIGTSSVETEGIPLEDAKLEMAKYVNPLFIWTYIILGVSLLALILVPLPHMLANPKSMRKFGLGLVLLGVIILIVYMISPSNPTGPSDPNWLPFIEDPVGKNTWVTWSSINVYAALVMTGLAVIAILLSSLKGLFKR